MTLHYAAVNSQGTFPPSNAAPAQYLLCETTSFCPDSLKTSSDSTTTLTEVLRGCLEKLKVAVPLGCAERKERSEYVCRVATEITSSEEVVSLCREKMVVSLKMMQMWC